MKNLRKEIDIYKEVNIYKIGKYFITDNFQEKVKGNGVNVIKVEGVNVLPIDEFVNYPHKIKCIFVICVYIHVIIL